MEIVSTSGEGINKLYTVKVPYVVTDEFGVESEGLNNKEEFTRESYVNISVGLISQIESLQSQVDANTAKIALIDAYENN